MNENIIKALEFYCQKVMDDFKKSDLFIGLEKKVENFGFFIQCHIGKELENSKSKDLYISFSVLNENYEFIDIFDDGFLSVATKIIQIDKKNKIKFLSWEDEDFIESLEWINKCLDNYRK